MNETVPKGVPDSTIHGDNMCEKLQNIYIKNMLFYMHISKVEEIEIQLWQNVNITQRLSVVKGRLNYHLDIIKHILTDKYPDLSLPPTPAPLHLPHDKGFQKKQYGCGVIIRLIEWLKEAKTMYVKWDTKLFHTSLTTKSLSQR